MKDKYFVIIFVFCFVVRILSILTLFSSIPSLQPILNSQFSFLALTFNSPLVPLVSWHGRFDPLHHGGIPSYRPQHPRCRNPLIVSAFVRSDGGYDSRRQLCLRCNLRVLVCCSCDLLFDWLVSVFMTRDTFNMIFYCQIFDLH